LESFARTERISLLFTMREVEVVSLHYILLSEYFSFSFSFYLFLVIFSISFFLSFLEIGDARMSFGAVAHLARFGSGRYHIF
jgi:hypothetical protein